VRRRCSAVFLTFFALAGCRSAAFKPSDFAPAVNLQDPLPEMAIVYLLRIPHDSATVTVYFDARKMAVMKPESYTAVYVKPGTYEIKALVSDSQSESVSAVLTVSAGERRFIYTSMPNQLSPHLSSVYVGRVGYISIVTHRGATARVRTWKECSELDAQGLISSAKVVLPEPGAI
jgi:hypothetical protein